MDEVAKIVSIILRTLAAECVVGQTGEKLNVAAELLIAEHGATSYNKGYHPRWSKRPYPAAICVSPNSLLIHGVPGKYEFREGDIITLDIGIKKNGFCGDAALTVPVGRLSNADERLLYYARQAVYEFIDQVKIGANTRDLAMYIEKWVAARGYYMNRKGAGHTIGAEMHMKPTIYNTVEDEEHTYADLKGGTVICIEPILSKSRDRVGATLSDGWSIVTMDRKNAAMFEHMVRINEDGSLDILTDHFNKNENFKRL